MRNLVIISFILGMFIFGCQSDNQEHVKDILYVKRAKAEMPAYIYGNSSSKVYVIVLHGGPGGSGLEYRIGAYNDQLEDKYAMVYFDQRGQGMSQGNYDSKSLTVKEMAHDVLLLADVLKHKYGSDISVFLMGHSWGGMLGTQTLLEDDKNRFKGWIEIDGAHDIPETFKQSFLKVANSVETYGDNSTFWKDIQNRISNMDSLNFSTIYINSTAYKIESKLTSQGLIAMPETDFKLLKYPFFVNNYLTSWVSGRITNGTLYNQELKNYTLTPRLKEIKIPTLLCWGKYDHAVPVALGEQAMQFIGSQEKELIVYEKSGHSPMITESQTFTADVIEFVERFK